MSLIWIKKNKKNIMNKKYQDKIHLELELKHIKMRLFLKLTNKHQIRGLI